MFSLLSTQNDEEPKRIPFSEAVVAALRDHWHLSDLYVKAIDYHTSFAPVPGDSLWKGMSKAFLYCEDDQLPYSNVVWYTLQCFIYIRSLLEMTIISYYLSLAASKLTLPQVY